MKQIRKRKEYAVYKGEEFVDLGTAEELAERLGSTKKTILWYAGSNRHKQQPHNRGGYTVVLIEEDDGE